MSRLRKNLNQPSVSLFPFLAVLICTLGVLIVMLVLAVKSAEVAKEQVQATEDQVAAAKIEEAQQRLALEKFRSESIHQLRSDVLARLSNSRQNRSYLQQDITDADKKVEATKKRIDLLKRSLDSADKDNPAETDQAEIRRLKNAIEQLKQQIAKAKKSLDVQRKISAEQGPSRFSLVPHQGSGGTFRRPIFLECLDNEIRLQPFGIRLSKQDFATPIQAGNPLDVALLTIQEHWQQLNVSGEHGSPYPLIVVRPDGAETFVLARRAMKSWTDEFGYELVDAKKELDFGEPDDLLVAKVNDVVQRSIDRQMQIAKLQYERERHLAQFSSNRAGPGFSVSKRGSGSVTTSAYQSYNDGGTQAAPIGFESNRTHSGTQPFDSKTQQASFQANRTSQRQSADNSNANQNSAAASSHFNDQAFSKPTGHNSKFTSSGNIAAPNSPQSAGQPQSTQQTNSPSNSSTPNLANRRGQGWALPSRPQGGTGYLRPITVVCSANDLQIKTATGQTRTIRFESDPTTAVDVMVEEIWNRIDSWGIAGQGSYWKPQLRIKTKPGGEQRFAMLQQMLHNSGLVIESEPPK